jgi:hypothetical protein
LLPAIAAASPVSDSKVADYLDMRLEVYRHNQAKVPSIAGKIVPEPVFSEADYDKQIFQPLYKDISVYDPDGLLQHEWLNSRGAIARFDRNAIEIRLIDVQECPKADLAIASFVIETLKALVSEKWVSYEEQCRFSSDDLCKVLLDGVREGENTLIHNNDYLKVFGMDVETAHAKDVWKHLYKELMTTPEMKVWEEPLHIILEEGTLASRILWAVHHDMSRESLKHVYGKLCECLAENKMFRSV